MNIAILLAIATGVASAASSTPRDAVHVANCLNGRHVIASPSTNHVVAPKSPQRAALIVTFALLPNVALNSGVLAFEKSSAIAEGVASQWLAYQLSRYTKAGLHVTTAMVRQTYFVRDNVVAIWNNEPGTTSAGRARATKILQACI